MILFIVTSHYQIQSTKIQNKSTQAQRAELVET